jgi:murein L,D-transpeptidase YcbB/YkuD
MGQEEEQTVNLEESLDVWLLYLTVWSGEGKLELREDVYDMDKKLAESLSLSISEHFL